MNPAEILQFVGIPVLVATAIVLCSWWLFPSKRVQPLGAVLAVGVSCLVAFILQEGMPQIPPSQKWHWLVVSVMLVFVLASLYPLFRSWDELIILQAIIAGGIAAVLMQFPNQGALYERFIVFLMVLFASVGLHRLTIPPWHMYVACWLILAGLSILALQSSFAKLAFFAGAMSAVSASLCVLQLLKPRETKSIQMIFGVLIVGCSLCGVAYDQDDSAYKLAWLVPMAGIPISAMVYLLLKHHKNRALFSLAVIVACVVSSILLSVLGTSSTEATWP